MTLSDVQAAPNASNSQIETQKSAAGVIAVDEHWTQAEIHGDVAWLDGMLLAGYRSVGATGIVSARSKILASAKKNATSDKMAKLVVQYMKDHPFGTVVTINGNTAVLNFYAQKLGAEKGVTSCDIFLYVGGRWRALYSQHTGVKA